jgi:hypothetical protein
LLHSPKNWTSPYATVVQQRRGVSRSLIIPQSDEESPQSNLQTLDAGDDPSVEDEAMGCDIDVLNEEMIAPRLEGNLERPGRRAR